MKWKEDGFTVSEYQGNGQENSVAIYFVLLMDEMKRKAEGDLSQEYSQLKIYKINENNFVEGGTNTIEQSPSS